MQLNLKRKFLTSKFVRHSSIFLFSFFLLFIISFYLGLNPSINIYSKSAEATRQKEIALTFDDGPSIYTKQILDILSQKNVHATFFVVGQNAKRHPDITKEIVDRGNIIGNHSYNHKIYLMYEPSQKLVDNFNLSEGIIYQITAKKPRFARPPYGLRTPLGSKALQANGYIIAMWNDSTHDYNKEDASQISYSIIKNARPGGIIVLHDGRENKDQLDRSNVVKALPLIIDELKKSGYQFVTVDELFKVDAYKP